MEEIGDLIATPSYIHTTYVTYHRMFTEASMLHSNRCLNTPCMVPSVHIQSEWEGTRISKHLIEQQGLSKHPVAFLSMSPRCEMNVLVTGILLLQFVPYVHMIMHWRMFTEVLMKLDAVEHPGPQ